MKYINLISIYMFIALVGMAIGTVIAEYDVLNKVAPPDYKSQ